MYDLYAVTLGQRGVRPLVAANYFVIKLDRNSRRHQRQFADEIIQRRSIPHFPTLTIELNQQILVSRLQEDLVGRMILRNSAVSPPMCACTRTAARPLSNTGSRMGIVATP